VRAADAARFVLVSLAAHRGRSLLTALGIAVGVAAVVLLTAVGEGARRYVLAQFTQFGTHLVAINPGRATTHGMSTGIFGTVRPLTLDDARALRALPWVEGVVPVVWGNADVEAGGRVRRTQVIGVGPDFPRVFAFGTATGRFLPADDLHAPRPLAVVGATVRRELFGEASPLGRRLRVAGYRFRVVGAMQPKGRVLGFDLDDAVYVPAAWGLEIFGREGLMEIDVLYRADVPVREVVAGIRRLLVARHGREDFTLTTQDQMLEVLGSVLGMLTFAVAGIGAISLAVGAVGILTIMVIAVSERRAEIGLLRALGATRRQVGALFLAEAAALAAAGGLAGLALGAGGAHALTLAFPALPVHTAWSYALAAEALAVAVGLAAGVLPALHAARLEPVEALRAE